MDKKQIGAKLVMDDLHLPFEIDQFDDRLILQKAIYLAQATGVDLGYYYRWYLHGPYCPALAKDGFAIKVELEQKIDESKRWHLDESSANKLDRLRPLLAESDRRALSRKLELLASVHFLVDRGQVPAPPQGNRHGPETLRERLRRTGSPGGAGRFGDARGSVLI